MRATSSALWAGQPVPAPAIEGKSWSHPVLVGDVVLVRNGQEMTAFRLRTAAVTASTR